MTDAPARYELEAGIATITMDDGKANVMSLAMLDAVGAALDRAEADEAVVVLTGRDRLFSAGYDLALFDQPPEVIVRTLRAGGDVVHRMLGFPTPIVVACRGHAVAQGAFLLLAADVRIGAAGSATFGLNEVMIGLTIPHYGVELARHRLSAPWSDRATVTGPLIGPDEALAAGFLDRVVEPEEVVAEARAEAERLTAVDLSAHRGTKQRVRGALLDRIRALHDEEFPDEIS
ncbi:MAG: crotonase/enoyl-CoA hydratase family protein [Actinomycetota bacterium]